MDPTLASTFDSVVDTIRQLGKTIDTEPVIVWMAFTDQTSPSGKSETLNQALTDFWYRDGQDGRETTAYFGLVACTPAVINEVKRVNEAKLQFKKAVSDFRNLYPTQLSEQKQLLAARQPHLAQHLAHEGLARLHLKQVSRQIPLVEEPLAKVGFNWYNSGRSIQKISKQDALKRLQKFNTDQPHIRIQYDQLATISDQEPLALVQKQAPIMRANLLFGNGDRKAMNVAMPLFFPISGGFPAHKPPAPEPPERRSRGVRSDNVIEEAPFLPSIRVHRYQ